MPADGRCLFRAIAHVTCLRNGEEAPDENRQRDLADDLRAEVIVVYFEYVQLCNHVKGNLLQLARVIIICY